MSIAHLYPATTNLIGALRRFSLDDYDKMADAGILGVNDRTELLDGLVYLKESGSLLPRRFTIDEYHRLGDIGVLGHDERLELIDGVIYTMSPIGGHHAACVTFLDDAFHEALQGRCLIRVQNPIHLPDHSEPEPDVALVRPRADRYRGNHPGPDDVFLIVEVMDTSALRDRGQKISIYAKAQIPELWLVDLPGDVVEVHSSPKGGVYTIVYARRASETVAPQAFPDVILQISDILG